MMTTPDDKRKALASILAAHPGNSCAVQCARIRAALSQFSLTTFEAMRQLDMYDPRAPAAASQFWRVHHDGLEPVRQRVGLPAPRRRVCDGDRAPR